MPALTTTQEEQTTPKSTTNAPGSAFNIVQRANLRCRRSQHKHDLNSDILQDHSSYIHKVTISYSLHIISMEYSMHSSIQQPCSLRHTMQKLPKEPHSTGSENVHHILLAWFGVPIQDIQWSHMVSCWSDCTWARCSPSKVLYEGVGLISKMGWNIMQPFEIYKPYLYASQTRAL